MAYEPRVNWEAIDADPRFQELHRRKSRFLWILIAISVLYYFLLPIGSAYCPALFRTKVWAVVNFGVLFALSEFVVTWLIANIHYRQASRRFDPWQRSLLRTAGSIGRAP